MPLNDLVRLLRRIAVTVAGTVILAVGAVLLVTPGPGLVVIALGLAVFAIEYQWARRHLAAVQARARSAALKAAASRVATASAVLSALAPSASALCWYSPTCCHCPAWEQAWALPLAA
ncbi:MAG TPA: PGPGW domain-containing protein [Streptosporangiaceae bacterium]|nr:PGPGW domain-containing protein [Streptosporangiaceae bacterium]